jgi:hypothetical protein
VPFYLKISKIVSSSNFEIQQIVLKTIFEKNSCHIEFDEILDTNFTHSIRKIRSN